MSKIENSINPQSQTHEAFEDLSPHYKPFIIHHEKVADQIVTYEDSREKEETEYYARRKVTPFIESLYREINYPTLKAASQVDHLDISKIEAIQHEKSQERFAESEIDKAFNEVLVDQKQAQNELIVDLFNQIRHTMNTNKDLHIDLNTLQKRIEKEAKTSEKLEWVNQGASAALAAYTVIAVSLTLATGGGLGPIFGVIGAVAAAAKGTVSVANTIRQMQGQERQGEASVLQHMRQNENEKIQKYLSENGIKLKDLHAYIEMQVQILNNYMQTYKSVIRG